MSFSDLHVYYNNLLYTFPYLDLSNCTRLAKYNKNHFTPSDPLSESSTAKLIAISHISLQKYFWGQCLTKNRIYH